MANILSLFGSTTIFVTICAVCLCPAFAKEPTVTVVVATVEQREMAPSMWVPGTIVSRNDAWISAEVSGRLTHVAEVGDAIDVNASLAQIDRRELELKLKDNEASVRRLQASLSFNTKQLNRHKHLRDSDSASKTQYDAAMAQQEMVAQELVQAKTASARTQYDLERTTVRAPFSGRVAERILQAGEFAEHGSRLLRLVDINGLEVRANAPIEVTPFVRPGDPVIVKSGGNNQPGSLRTVVPIADALSRSIELRVRVSPSSALVGSAVRIKIPTAERQYLNVVPRDALHLRSRSQHIVVIKNRRAQVVVVQPGLASEEWVAVDKVSVGDLVVLQGGERLRDGQLVSVLAQNKLGSE